MIEKKITAIDIGVSRIKVLIGSAEKKNNPEKNFILPYRHFKTEDQFSVEELKNYYFQFVEEIKEALKSIKHEIPLKSEVRVTFNSMFAKIFIKKVKYTSVNKIDNFGQLYAKKLSNEKMHAGHFIAEINKKNNESDIVVYSYEKAIFADFISLLETLGLNADLVEFDVLSLANAYLSKTNSGNCIMLDVGMGKTSVLIFSEKKLVEIEIIPNGMLLLYKNVAQKYGVSLEAAEKMLTSGNIQHTYWEPLLSEIAKKMVLRIKKDPDIKLYLSGGLSGNRTFKRLLDSLLGLNTEDFEPFETESNNEKGQKASLYSTVYGLFLD